MKFLALDTSSDACSIALQLGDAVTDRHIVQAKEHTKILVPLIRELMTDGGAEFSDLDAIVLGNGPGSFIGMRIAASVAQGLAFAAGKKIVPVSSMAAIAAEVMDRHQARDVIVAQDARMNEAYLGIYRSNGAGLPVAAADEALQAIEKIEGLADLGGSGLIAAGRAWRVYPALLELNRDEISEAIDVFFPRARYLLGLGASMWHAGEAIEPEKLVPAYIRMRVANPPTANNA